MKLEEKKTGDGKSVDDAEDIRVWPELKRAGITWVAAVALAMVIAYATIVLLLLKRFEWGEFGDSFGALTSLFNALAFAAVVVTVVLQSKELRDSRRELTRQAISQEKWAEAALRQIEVTERLERLKIRPVITSEWTKSEKPANADRRYLKLRNLGLGAGIIDKIELVANSKTIAVVESSDEQDAPGKWHAALIQCGLPKDTPLKAVRLKAFRDRTRILAPGDNLTVIEVDFGKNTGIVKAAMTTIPKQFEPVIYFRSLDGERIDTRSQLGLITLVAEPATAHLKIGEVPVVIKTTASDIKNG